MALDPITGGEQLAQAALSLGQTFIQRFFPDKDQAAKAQAALDAMQASGELQIIAQQLQINAVEAASSNLFTSGWRPFIGWVCGFGVMYQFLLYPLLKSAFAGMVPLDVSNLMALLGSMLGLGTLRSFEKWKNVEGNR